MSIPDDYKDIIEMLSTATTEGRVNWLATRYDVQVTVSESRFSLWAGNDMSSKQDFVAFALSDRNGKNLDTWFVGQASQDYDFMHRLYIGARRTAMEIPRRLATIREEFRSAKIIGAPASRHEEADMTS